ncbi:MAG: sensor domain-containing diguanylate cyclase [Anaeromicrobium sp.]|jgi:diguanylate cyclase (GGDEF)-like protein|uniref:sensor domain-containing diguanylate cyclase n=1 Tax=Anaeromicrobium sp. TaxID=1929132 RepID=UPI0025F50F0B|nr:sensor domain-containing diguanylate cyclase [Anaeromicrobium sp.]MCT4592984.1 sensor domain-containing diguanylate cyclase [Anaeromicrobium sp.]
MEVKKSYENRFYEVGDKITSQTTNALTHWIDHQVRVVKMISKDKRVINACRFPENEGVINEAQEFLQEVHSLYPYYENLPISAKLDKSIIRSVNGKEVEINHGEFLVDTVGGKTVGKGGMKYSYVREIFKGKEYFISEIYPSILRGNPIFVISAPIIYDSEIIGVALISPKIEYFTKTFVDNVNFENTGYMFFVDDRGVAIAHPNREMILRNNHKFENIGEKILNTRSNKNNYFQADFMGQEKFYISTEVHIPSENIMNKWYIVFTQKKGEVLQHVKKYFNIIMALVIIATVVVVGAIYLVSSINQKELHKDQLEKMNRSLENKVEERTKELIKLAKTDGLTQLVNHQTAYEKLEEAIYNSREREVPLVLIMADLDRFKRVNDTYGHQVGDEVLKDAAFIISSNIGEEHTAGRYGGEEFIIILPNTDLDEGLRIGNSIKEHIASERFSIEGLRVTVSMGIRQWNGESSTDLVKYADKALYRAKENGRNRIEIG